MLRLHFSGLSKSNPWIDRAPVKPFDPIAFQAAAARSEGQGWPDACPPFRTFTTPRLAASRSGRRSLALDRSEHGGRLQACRDGGVCAFVRGDIAPLFASVMLAISASTACADPPAYLERSAHAGSTISSSDPWSAHIREAAKRFAIPERLLRAVMHVESVGDVHAVSSKGAMGLMQIMPPTWEELRSKYHLGGDPYQPRDNIFAGAAYLREMLDRFGQNGFLAAYNAGPGRYEEHLATGRPLPRETIDYVRKLAPLINGSVPIQKSGRQAGRASALHSSVFVHTGAVLATGASNGNRDADAGVDTMFEAVRLSSMRSDTAGHVTDLTAFEPQPDGSSHRDASAPKPADSLFIQHPPVAAQ